MSCYAPCISSEKENKAGGTSLSECRSIVDEASVISMPYLIHSEVSVVKVAGASLEANFSHAVVDQKKIPQLQDTQSHKTVPSNGSFAKKKYFISL